MAARTLARVIFMSRQRDGLAAGMAGSRGGRVRDLPGALFGHEDGDQPQSSGRPVANEAGLAPADDADQSVSAHTGGPTTDGPDGGRRSRKSGGPSRMADPRSPAVLPATAEEAGGDR